MAGHIRGRRVACFPASQGVKEEVGMRISFNARLRLAVFFAVAAVGSLGVNARAGTYYVDPNYTGVNGAAYGTYTAAYNSIAAALGSSGVPSGASASNPNTIFIAPGTYITGTSSLSYSKNNVTLVGITGNPSDVVITSYLDAAYNPGSGALGTTNSSSLQLKGNNINAFNITFANSTDTPYIVNVAHQAVTPTGSYTGNAQTATSQGVALLLQGDEQAFQNCDFLGYQDTLYTKGGRDYFNDCSLSGDIDFIFANGTDVFNNCTLNLDGDHSGGDIVAPSTDKRTSNGFVFLNCTVTGNSVHGNSVLDPLNAANVNGPAAGSMYLGRPWGWTQAGGDSAAVFVNTMMSPAIKSVGWLAWDTNETESNYINSMGQATNSGNPAEDARFAEYNSMDLNGNPLNVSGRVSWSEQLTASQASAYTVNNIFADDPWFGLGYSGSSNPSSPNYSWPAFWGPRNNENESDNDNIVGNPTSYSDPSWTLGGNWNPSAQLATAETFIPEPTSISVFGAMGLLMGASRRMGRKRVKLT
jgi:pectin methylesterase-like acyl-CoA thioesterase